MDRNMHAMSSCLMLQFLSFPEGPESEDGSHVYWIDKTESSSPRRSINTLRNGSTKHCFRLSAQLDFGIFITRYCADLCVAHTRLLGVGRFWHRFFTQSKGRFLVSVTYADSLISCC